MLLVHVDGLIRVIRIRMDQEMAMQMGEVVAEDPIVDLGGLIDRVEGACDLRYILPIAQQFW